MERRGACIVSKKTGGRGPGIQKTAVLHIIAQIAPGGKKKGAFFHEISVKSAAEAGRSGVKISVSSAVVSRRRRGSRPA